MMLRQILEPEPKMELFSEPLKSCKSITYTNSSNSSNILYIIGYR